ncbi:MAG TPA: NAD-dependent epimerase/dehydratase family protein, partial [Minicystis sp.]|nr:NAD-dependent epimerase/dehydratase family protein [Minicystis sp.]
MHVAVTGGSGQLGTQLLRKLARSRAVREIVSIDLAPPRVASAKIRHVACDVRDPELGRHLEGCEAVVHLAARVTQAGDAELASVNVDGSRNVMESAARAGASQLLVASTEAAYGVAGQGPAPITEHAARVRADALAYAASKYDLERDVDAFEADHPGVAVCRLRPSLLFGARMEHPFGRMLLAGFCPGAPFRLAVVWDEDVAAAFALAVERRARGA